MSQYCTSVISKNDQYILVELGLVIGKQGRFISRSEAFNHIGGYFLLLDLTSKLLF